MRAPKLLAVVCLAITLGASAAGATVVTISDSFYATGFVGSSLPAAPAAPAAPADPVTGSFTMTYDNTLPISTANFAFAINLPIQKQTSRFSYSPFNFIYFEPDSLITITGLTDITGIAQLGLSIDAFRIDLDMTDPSKNIILYAVNGLNTYISTMITFTPVANNVLEPSSILIFGFSLLAIGILYLPKRAIQQ